MNRVEKLQELIRQKGLDGAIISSPINRRYFTSFPSSAGAIFVTPSAAWLVLDSRYCEAAKRTVRSCEVVLMTKLDDDLKGLMARTGAKTVALESRFLSYQQAVGYQTRFDGVEMDLSGWLDDAIETMRQCKDENEVAIMKKAQQLTDQGFSYILNHIRPGVKEKDVSLELAHYLLKNGATGLAFDFIVVSGTNSSLPHGVPSEKKIADGDFVTLDFGAAYEGYCSDMTRTVAVGSVTEEQERVYQTVFQAQREAFTAIAPGQRCDLVDKAARDYIYTQGYEGCFGHGLGHSLGLEIHENPRFSPLCDKTLLPGMAITVEPGIYLEGKFGVRIEDVVILGNEGYENITKSPKNLIIL